jgi:hypothetical protein
LTVQQFAALVPEFTAHGVPVVRVFHSPVAALQGLTDLPLTVLADPHRDLYRQFGVQQSLWSLFHWRAWPRVLASRRAGLRPRWRDALRDGFRGLPADFLVGPDGLIERCHYGRIFTDHLPPQEALAWLSAAPVAGRRHR